ncbi:MAG: hypothetical protein JXM70_22425 [Pirellulales bacterium]|nr:hypothetical protein [Pirellulales bacterium]
MSSQSMHAGFLLVTALLSTTIYQAPSFAAEEEVGSRPYEMVWADRTQDTHPPLVDFENLDGWTVKANDAKATLKRSRSQQLWDKYVAELVYRRDGNQPCIIIKPPKPIDIKKPFDCVNFWVYGNNWSWVPDPGTPQVAIRLLLRNRKGQLVGLDMGRVRWQQWWVMHHRLTPAQLNLLADGAVFEGIEITGGRNKQDRVLYFDNLSFYQERLEPLAFDPRPARGIKLPEGQTSGTNTGPGLLPFPTREETILPDNLIKDFKNDVEKNGKQFLFHYRGDDGHLVYRYRPDGGDLGDIEVEWSGKSPNAKPHQTNTRQSSKETKKFRPMVDGGIYFHNGEEESSNVKPEKIEMLSCRQDGDSIVSKWKATRGKQSTELTYTLRLWQKSLVVDVKCVPTKGTDSPVGEFRIGHAGGVDNPRLVTIPYLTGNADRPAVLVSGTPHNPLFTIALIDHTRSNASLLWADNEVGEEGPAGQSATYNGGTRYLPKTDGNRNPCFERLFLTVSPEFEEILPNIPNPKSPWMHVTGERVWRAHGAGDRTSDYEYWKNIARHGMDKILITDHETGWRDGGESFTFRTRAAPGKGGDAGQLDYTKKIHALGYLYGIYNNYTDYAPVNELWDEDCVTRTPDGNWQTAWPRCYNPKPSRAVEFEARLAPIIQDKFGLNTAYCDVHTAVTPWSYVDFDARVPGAGTFAATFYAYGEIMLHQKRTWNGPVYSEGNNHWYYCGLTDGNYAQDQRAQLPVNPWLVDFDLRKMHPLCCNFGIGNPGMFFSREELKKFGTGKQWEDALDRFLAATLAFGHTGFLVGQGGMPCTVRSYFCVQQIHFRYARQKVASIRYADDSGKLLSTSQAVVGGAFRRSQVVVTYDDGLKVIVNGHPSESWKIDDILLPPNGWMVQDPRNKSLVAWSKIVGGHSEGGHRADYVNSPTYIYADGRGRFTRFEKAAVDGQLIAKRIKAQKSGEGSMELIPVETGRWFGIALDEVSPQGRPVAAVALDKTGKELGPVETRLSRGLLYVTPVEGAFSYILSPKKYNEGIASGAVLDCDRIQVVPGERVTITSQPTGVVAIGKTSHVYTIPTNTQPGTLLWHEHDNHWIDFSVVPLVDAALRLEHSGKEPGGLRLTLTSHAAKPVEAKVALAGHTKTVRLIPETPLQLSFEYKLPNSEAVSKLPLSVTAGDLSFQKTWWHKTEYATVDVAPLPDKPATGQRLRGQDEETLKERTGSGAYRCDRACGEVTKNCLFMHPPYKGVTGYTFATFGPVSLPPKPRAALNCLIGKGDGSDPGDGILFRVAVIDRKGIETLVADHHVKNHAWTPLVADLSRWAGQEISIKLIADPGAKDNTSGDWACWADLIIQSTYPVLQNTLHEKPVELRYLPGPDSCEDLTVADIRKAKKATLHYQGIGLGAAGKYRSYGHINNIPLGTMVAAGGNESKNTWADAAVPLNQSAMAKLTLDNHFKIVNPAGDCFKIRRVWLELELSDGRRCSSRITTTIYSQPSGWAYAEGTRVAADKDIELRIRFDGPNKDK